MKLPGCRIVITCLVMIVFLAWPVHADPIATTLVNYSFFQNNQPIDDSINLSVKCYGLYNEYRSEAMGRQKNTSDTANTELVYSFSLSCDPNNCFRQDTYDTTVGMIISSCDLEGVYKGKPFLVKNFTIMPEPTCFSIARWNVSGIEHYYVLSSEDRKNCTKKYPSERSESERPLCYENYTHPINTTVVSIYHTSLYCEQRFDIPSDDQTASVISSLTRPHYTPQSPVESLYCSIIQFFGGRCE